jgi:hypothetical protein
VVTTYPPAYDYVESASATIITATVAETVRVSDSDSLRLERATVAISVGYRRGEDILSFANTSAARFSDVTGNFDEATGILTLTSSAPATVAQWQEVLRAVGYANLSQDPHEGVRTVAFSVFDESHSSNTATRDIVVTARNDAPGGRDGKVTLDEDSVLTLTSARMAPAARRRAKSRASRRVLSPLRTLPPES